MSRAEERALEAYPIVMSQHSDNCKEYDSNESDRLTFIEGYHQAEKDLELTWEDCAKIDDIAMSLYDLEEVRDMPNKEFYTEVLRRFKLQKG